MSEIKLRALSAGTPIGFLAALGAFRHTSQMTEQLGNVRLRWERKGSAWSAILVASREADEQSLLSLLVERVQNLGVRPELAWADQIKKNSPEKFRDAIAQNANRADWFAAFGTELALSKENTLKSTDLDMTGGQQKFLSKLRDASAALSAPEETRTLLAEALFGPWQYRPSRKASELENSHSLGLDPSTILQGAFTADEPAGIKDKRGVRGAIWLAFESMPLFPCAVSNGRLRTTGFTEEYDGRNWKHYFEWGVWEAPLTTTAIQTLLQQSRDEWTRQRGISERFRSERVNLNKDYYSLAPAELVVAEQTDTARTTTAVEER